MELRPFTMDMYDEVCSLWQRTPGMGLRSLDDTPEGIGRFLRRNPGTCFIITDEQAVVGVILCGNDGRRAYIYHAAVDREYRGRGLGRLLVEEVLKELRVQRISKVALVAYGTNRIGNGFWEHLGFHIREDLVYRDLALVDQQSGLQTAQDLPDR